MSAPPPILQDMPPSGGYKPLNWKKTVSLEVFWGGEGSVCKFQRCFLHVPLPFLLRDFYVKFAITFFLQSTLFPLDWLNPSSPSHSPTSLRT